MNDNDEENASNKELYKRMQKKLSEVQYQLNEMTKSCEMLKRERDELKSARDYWQEDAMRLEDTCAQYSAKCDALAEECAVRNDEYGKKCAEVTALAAQLANERKYSDEVRGWYVTGTSKIERLERALAFAKECVCGGIKAQYFAMNKEYLAAAAIVKFENEIERLKRGE